MNKRTLKTIIAMCVLFFCAVQSFGQLFKKEDKVVFIGNSITMNGGFYHQIALYYALTKPAEKFEIINCGINGNVATNVVSRMDSDILVNKPNWAVVMVGMNDVRKELYHPDSSAAPGIELRRTQALDVYAKKYEQIIQLLLAKKVNVILQTPSIYDQTSKMPSINYVGRNDALQRCAAIVKTLAEKYHLKLVDYQQIMLDVNRKLQLLDPAATLIGADRVHPGEAGHFVMACQFLHALGINSGDKGLHVDLNSKADRDKYLLKQDNVKLNFSAVDPSLPLPVNAAVAKVATLLPFNPVGEQLLTVKGLKEGTYILKVDQVPLGNYSSNQLQQGVNLATQKLSPQYKQALTVLGMFEKYWKLEAAYRSVKLVESYQLQPVKMYTLDAAEGYFSRKLNAVKDTTSAAYRNLKVTANNYLTQKRREGETKKAMAALLGDIYKTAQPTVHQWTLVQAGAGN